LDFLFLLSLIFNEFFLFLQHFQTLLVGSSLLAEVQFGLVQELVWQ